MRGRYLWVGLLLAAASGCVSTHQKDWVEVRSPHFVVKSAIDQDKAQRLAHDLERFRQVVASVTNSGELEDPPIPTRIFVFDRQSFREFRPGLHIGGFFMPGLRANWIVMTEARFTDAQDIVQHEYAHYVLHNIGGATYPRWYDEGFAEFLSTVREEGGEVYVGRPSPRQLAMLHAASWIPISKLIANNPDKKLNASQFYGEAWALVHFLFFGRDDRKDGEVSHFLTALEARVEPSEAFAQAFGMTVEQADERVQSYMRSKINTIIWPDGKFAPIVDIRLTPVASHDIATDLGELALRCSTEGRDLTDHAETYFRAAIAQKPSGRAYSGLGTTFTARGKLDDAERYLRQAIELEPRDPLIELDYGDYGTLRASQATSREERARWLAEARKHYVRAWKMDPDIPESYASYGLTFTYDGEDPHKGLATLEHAAGLIPSNLKLRVGLATLYLRMQRKADARTLLLTAVAWMHPDDPNIKIVHELLARTEGQ